MRKAEKLLEQALSEMAMEETSRLSQTLTFHDMQKAQEMHAAHSKAALSLIRKNTRPSAAVYLRTAAVIAVIVGGIWLLRPSAQSPRPATPPTALPVQPFAASTLSPTSSPIKPTQSPTISTEQPIITPFISPSPTLSPLPTNTPTPSPTSTPTPDATQTPENPFAWDGRYFPDHEKERWRVQETDENDVFCAVMDDNYIYTEYTRHTTLSADALKEREYRYVMVGNVPALLTKDQAGQYTLIWDVEGRTLSIFAPDGDEETLLQIAESVKQVPGK